MAELTGYISGMIGNIIHKVTELHYVDSVIFNIALIFILAAILGYIARILKQPIIAAYILVGLIIGPLVLGLVSDANLIYAFSEIGIAFLLFATGLELSFKSIKEANLKKMAFIGFFQAGIVVGITLLLSNMLNLTPLQAVYIGIMASFSSTMVGIKLLADKNELLTLHGRLTLGILLIQDLIAIIVIAIFSSGDLGAASITSSFVKLLLMAGAALLLQKYVLNRALQFAAKSTELLFLSSLAILFLFIIFSYLAGLSIVIGAFMAGVAVANSRFKPELESRNVPLRDFFTIIFFVVLGMQFTFEGISQNIPLLITLFLITLVINPAVTFMLLRVTGYHQKTSFLTTISLTQISEFSLKIGVLGVYLGILDASIFSVIILTTIITMSLTPHFIKYNHNIYQLFRSPLKVFKFIPMSENLEYGQVDQYQTLLVGSHRMGSSLLKDLMEKKSKFLVVDYNPEIISSLMKNKVPCIYGDVYSPELLSKIDIKKLKTVVSTVPGFNENLYLLKRIKMLNKKINVIVTSTRISEAIELYSEGADYVIMPKILAGEEISHVINSKNINFKNLKKKHIHHLKGIHNILY